MKIIVMNLTGNVGKSTLAIHLLGAHMPGAKIISVEDLNDSNVDAVDSIAVDHFASSQFRNIFREVMFSDSVVVDVGSSNVRAFMAEVSRYASSVGEFDMVVVPTVPENKQMKDTIQTIEWLHVQGFHPKRVRVVFNQFDEVSGGQDPSTAFAYLLGYLESDGKDKATYQPMAVMSVNEIFQMANSTRKTIREIAEDPTDWKAARKAAKDAKDMDALGAAVDGQMRNDLARLALGNLRQCFDALMTSGSKRSARA